VSILTEGRPIYQSLSLCRRGEEEEVLKTDAGSQAFLSEERGRSGREETNFAPPLQGKKEIPPPEKERRRNPAYAGFCKKVLHQQRLT